MIKLCINDVDHTWGEPGHSADSEARSGRVMIYGRISAKDVWRMIFKEGTVNAWIYQNTG